MGLAAVVPDGGARLRKDAVDARKEDRARAESSSGHEVRKEICPSVLTAQGCHEVWQAFVHSVVHIAMVVGELLVAMRNAERI